MSTLTAEPIKNLTDEELMQVTGGATDTETHYADPDTVNELVNLAVSESRQADGSLCFYCQSCGVEIVGLNEQAFRNKLYDHLMKDFDDIPHYGYLF